MNRLEFRKQFRLDTRDLKAPYRWSNDEIDSYANRAVEEACRRANLLVDSTSALTEIAVSAGDTCVELDESVIFVRRGKLVSAPKALDFRVVRTMDELVPGWEDAKPSQPLVAIPDWESGKLRFWPPAARGDTLKITAVRVPTRAEQMTDDSDVPKIPSRYHWHLLDWMYHLAYLKRDADTFDPKKASEYEARFTAEFGPPSAAIDEAWAAEQYYDVGHR